MSEFSQNIEQFVSLARIARDEYRNNNFDSLRDILKDMCAIPTHGTDKYNVLNFITGNSHEAYGDWAEDLILTCLKETTTLDEFFQQLLYIEMACTEESRNKAKKIIIDRIDSVIDTVDFYRFRQKFIDYYFEGTEVFPLFFNVQPVARLSEEAMAETQSIQFIEYREDDLIIKVDDIFLCETEDEFFHEQMASSESYRQQTFKEWDYEKEEEDAFVELFKEEEELYNACIVDGEPDMEKLEAVAPSSSKAWYLLLKLQNKDYNTWFLNPQL